MTTDEFKTDFTCHAGRFHLSINLRQARRLAATCGIDVLNFNEYPRLLNSLGLRLEVVWFLIQDQAKDEGLGTFDDFEAALCHEDNPEAVTDASNALQAALIFFYRRLNQPSLRAMAEANLEVMIKGQQALPTTTDGFDSLKADMKKGEPTNH